MPDYSDILNVSRESFKEPQPLPVGSYTATVKNVPNITTAGKKNSTIAEVEFVLTAAGPDVDAAELAAAGGLPKDFKHTFWLTSGAGYIADRFLEAVGVTKADADTFGEAFPLTQGRSAIVNVVLGKKNTKTGRQYPELSTTFAAA